jgi:hypothetical protein
MKARLWLAGIGVTLGSMFFVQVSDAVAPPTAGQQEESAGLGSTIADTSGRSAVESMSVPVGSLLPKTAMFTSEKATEKLRAAFAVALERVREVPGCGALFAELGADGVEMLTTTIYMPTHPFDEQSLCRSAAAFTWVGGVHTRLCRRFSSLSEERAAMTLIHEALHHAGLTEKPMDPDGMTAREIDAMVGDACGRKSLQHELSARLEHDR